MKNTKILIVFSLAFFLISCTVNSTTGRVLLINHSDVASGVIKVGSTILSLGVPAGGSESFYFIEKVSGALDIPIITTNSYNNTSISLYYNLGYGYSIQLSKVSSGYGATIGPGYPAILDAGSFASSIHIPTNSTTPGI